MKFETLNLKIVLNLIFELVNFCGFVWNFCWRCLLDVNNFEGEIWGKWMVVEICENKRVKLEEDDWFAAKNI